jgi:hypothetical protein
MSTVNINTENNTVSIQDINQEISVTDNNKNTTVSIPQTNTNIVQVNTPGPQGPVGPVGTGGGSSIDTGSFATTGSNIFYGNQIINNGGISLGGQADGNQTIAIGDFNTKAIGEASIAHGVGSKANGFNSHAEGSATTANGDFSHTEGDNTQANGNYSHAEGQETKTLESAQYSHAEGYNTIASANYQHVQGQWNATSSIPAAFIVGNGTDNDNRSNLIYAAGNAVQITGSLNVTNGITGSLQGSASFASTSSRAVSASFASTASYINTLNQNVQITGSVYINVGNDGTFQIIRGNKTITIATNGDFVLMDSVTGAETVISSTEITINS